MKTIENSLETFETFELTPQMTLNVVGGGAPAEWDDQEDNFRIEQGATRLLTPAEWDNDED